MRKIIQEGASKGTCSRTIDDGSNRKYSVTITKHKKPIAAFESIEPHAVFGRMKGSVIEKGDLIEPID